MAAESVTCPECGADLNFPSKVMIGEIVPCPECGVELEVTGVDPVTVDLAPMEMEDWGE